MIAQDSAFIKFWQLGYKNLVPIVPPNAEISEHSALRPKSCGKAVGIKGHDGKWRGYDWIKAPPSNEDNIAAWAAMGAGVGIKTGNGLVALDIDSLDPALSSKAVQLAVEMLGSGPVRIGKAPKHLILYRVSGDVPYTRVEFTGHKGQNERVELLSSGRQFVAHGVHPDTGRPYTWGKEPNLSEVPTVTPEQIAAYFAKLHQTLPAATKPITEGSDIVIDQSALKGDIQAVRKAVEAIPNTSALFPTRDAYRDFGYAIKAALPDDEDAAFSLFADWCARWDGGYNDPETVQSDWRRMKPPYRRGAPWLFELADKHGGSKFKLSEIWFDQIEDASSPFDIQAATSHSQQNEDISIEWRNPIEWDGMPLKEREWEVEGWIPKGEVTLLYGDGGIGKTLLTHQYATCAAAGINWLGQPTRQARVMCFFCEDSDDELHRRQKDINASYGLSLSDISANLRIASRKYMDNLFVLFDRHNGGVKQQAIYSRLLADARAFKADVVVVDTIADTFGGSEIDRQQVNTFVKSILGRLAQEIGGSVIVLGHPSMAGKASGSGTSGSTAWSNAARSRLYMRYPKGADKGDVRELEGMKSNYGPKGNLLRLKWNKGAFDVIAGTVLNDSSSGEARHIPTLADADESAVLQAIAACGGISMSMSMRASNYAPRVLKTQCPDILGSLDTAAVDAAMRRLELAGAIQSTEIGRNSNRKAVTGYKVMLDNLSIDAPSESGVFA